LSLERSLALFFLTISIIYGYTSFFIIDVSLPPFAKMSPVWPSSFPKVLSAMGVVLGFFLVFSKPSANTKTEIDLKHLQSYSWVPAFALLGMMVAYALLLRPMGFIVSTFSFLVIGSMVLGERKLLLLSIVSLIGSGGIWYLVQEVLGIYLRPWPWFLSGGF
jgi:putative tricarboxylic transport membrane protein